MVGVLGVYAFQLNAEVNSLSAKVDNLSAQVRLVSQEPSGTVSTGPLESRIDVLSSDVKALASEVSRLADLSGQPSDVQLKSSMTPVEIYERASASVVAISVEIERSTAFGVQRGLAAGSGFMYDSSGHVVTNNHVVEGASKVEVVFQGGTSVEARVVGADPYSDLAVLKLSKVERAPEPLVLGDSSKLRIGEPVVAIGNPLGLSGSATSGIVSQLGRLLPADGYSITGVIQIDAAVNPGNSGGPLLNQRGEVVGITTAIASPTGVFSGIGFAVPSNTVKREVPFLIETGKYDHPWFGISGALVTSEVAEAMNLNFTGGILIVDVVSGSPADQAGLRPSTREVQIEDFTMLVGGDIVTGVDGNSVSNLEDLLVYIEENKRPGDTVVLQIFRDGAETTADVTLGTRPPL